MTHKLYVYDSWAQMSSESRQVSLRYDEQLRDGRLSWRLI